MSAAVARWRWQFYAQRLGETHPRVRALFGRYVAAVGGHLAESAGPAYRAWARVSLRAGWGNRSHRWHRT